MLSFNKLRHNLKNRSSKRKCQNEDHIKDGIPDENWIYKYLDLIHPDKLINVENPNDFIKTFLEGLKISPGVPIVNGVLLKFYSKNPNDFIKKNIHDRKSRFDFKSLLKEKNLVNTYISICTKLHKLTDDVITCYLQMEKLKDGSGPRKDVEQKWKKIQNQTQIVQKNLDQVSKLKSRKSAEKIIMDHLKNECFIILEKLLHFLPTLVTDSSIFKEDCQKNLPSKKRRCKNIFSICVPKEKESCKNFFKNVLDKNQKKLDFKSCNTKKKCQSSCKKSGRFKLDETAENFWSLENDPSCISTESSGCWVPTSPEFTGTSSSSSFSEITMSYQYYR